MIYEAKNRLHFSLSSGTSLIPSNLLDTQSTLGHHYSLKKESSDLKHRVNKSVNLEMKSVGVRNKNGDSSKVNRQTSQVFGQASKGASRRTAEEQEARPKPSYSR